MDLVPQSRIGKVVLSAWLLLCLSLLAFAYVQREDKDMAAIFTTSLVALTAPLSLPPGAAVGMSMSWLYANQGLPYHPFTDLVPSWVVMVAAGYLQWFVLVPSVVRRLRRRPGDLIATGTPPGLD
ncbi:MAG: hypothetical protein CFE46_10760 [Burkholderiales bacterium PBB6]|nr:MAG: hypothetical protein CFE46_10760 [Burkholderiales bacterium PBB6]